MPRNDDQFRLGDYWLSPRPNSEQWCRTWFDRKARQTRRTSIGTADFQEAQLRLAKWIVENQELRRERRDRVPLETILVRYYHEHASKIPSAEQARIALAKWSDFFGEAVISELTPQRQEAFVAHLREQGNSDGYISRVLSVGRAALNRSWKRQEIEFGAVHYGCREGAPEGTAAVSGRGCCAPRSGGNRAALAGLLYDRAQHLGAAGGDP